jgi:hypothetical protein
MITVYAKNKNVINAKPLVILVSFALSLYSVKKKKRQQLHESIVLKFGVSVKIQIQVHIVVTLH